MFENRLTVLWKALYFNNKHRKKETIGEQEESDTRKVNGEIFFFFID